MFHRALALLSIGALAAGASGQQVFSSDFESGAPPQFSGAGSVQGSQGYSALGFGGNMWRNDAGGDPQPPTVLTLTNLPAHTSMSISCLLGAIDSWDGIGGNPGPDTFVVRVDGVDIYTYIIANASGVNGPSGGATTLADNQQLGFSGWGDDAYDLGTATALQNFAHTGSSVTIEFFARSGWQGGGDESWSIDNLRVSVIPAPGVLALVGLGGLGALRRRR